MEIRLVFLQLEMASYCAALVSTLSDSKESKLLVASNMDLEVLFYNVNISPYMIVPHWHQILRLGYVLGKNQQSNNMTIPPNQNIRGSH